MEVRKSNGKTENFSTRKLTSIIKKVYKSAGIELSEEKPEEIINSLKVFDGIPCSNIRKQLEEIFFSQDERLYYAYKRVKDKNDAVKDFVEAKKAFIAKYKQSSNTANATVDDNSNVANKNIGILNAEIHKTDNIQISRGMVMQKLKELFPDFNEKQYLKDLESHIIYKHDESSFAGAIAPYCCSISMYPFLNGGIKGIGGLSAAPKNIDSYCGMYVNLIFATSAMFAGACMYKDQQLFIRENGVTKKITAKELVDSHLLEPKTFENYQGNWEYSSVKDMFILEDGRLVPVKKVYRRNYNNKIYEIKTKGGICAKVSKDHIFKQLFQGRQLNTRADQLKEYDTVFINTDYSSIIDNTTKEFKRGWVIGMLCGDGCLTKENAVSLSVNYQQEFLGDIYNEYSEEVFGYTLHKNKGHRCWNYSKHSKEYLDLIHEDIIGNTTYDKHINLEGKSIDYIAGFLDGLFCSDGSYSKGHGITISLTNKDLAENIHNAVAIFGFNTQLSYVKPRGNRKESWQQYISAKILKYLKHITLKGIGSAEEIYDVSREIYYYGYNSFQGRNTSNKRMKWSSSNQPIHYKTDVIESITVLDNDDPYVYEIETESHWYNCGGFITHNCATSEFLLYFTHFAKKEWGDDFWTRPDEVITKSCTREKTIRSQIHQYWQQVIYSINQPAAARGLQSAFVNFSYFDKPFFEGMFGNFYFPDGTQPDWESLEWIQKEFMMWFNAERLKTMLTFPVESFALVYKDGDFVDKESAKFVAEEYARGHSFFTYISDSVDSLSSCCRYYGDWYLIKKISENLNQLLELKKIISSHVE